MYLEKNNIDPEIQASMVGLSVANPALTNEQLIETVVASYSNGISSYIPLVMVATRFSIPQTYIALVPARTYSSSEVSSIARQASFRGGIGTYLMWKITSVNYILPSNFPDGGLPFKEAIRLGKQIAQENFCTSPAIVVALRVDAWVDLGYRINLYVKR